MTYCTECGADLGFDPGRICPFCDTAVGDTVRPHRRGLVDFSLTFPWARGFETLALSTLLLLLSILVLPLLVLYGYGVRLGRAAMRGDPEPPRYEDWGGLLVDGLLLFVAWMPFSVFALALFGGLLYVDVVWLAVVLYVPVAYVGGAIYPTFLATGSVRATYANLRFVRFAATIHYLKGVLVLLVLTVLIFVAAWSVGVILALTIVGVLLWFPLYLVTVVYLLFVTDAVWGHVYYVAAEADAVPPVSNPDSLRVSF